MTTPAAPTTRAASIDGAEMRKFLTNLAGGVQARRQAATPGRRRGGLTMLTEDARNFNWLLSHFVDETAGVTGAVAVSSDGLLIARSNTMDRDEGEQLCAIISGAPASPTPPTGPWRAAGWTR